MGWGWLIKPYSFKYTARKHIICILHCVLTTQSLLLPPFVPPLPSSTSPHPPFPLAITILQSVSFFFLCSIPSPFHPAPKPHPFWQLSVCSLYYVLVPTLLVSLFCSLDSTYKWNHIVFVFLWLAYFTSHNTVQVHPLLSQKVRFSSFVQLSTVPLCECTTAFSSIHLPIGTWAASKPWLL